MNEQAETEPVERDDEVLQRRARLGHALRKEIAESEGLNAVLQMIEAESNEAKEELIDADPTNTAEIVALQRRASLSGLLNARLAEFIETGEEAERMLEEQADAFSDE